MKLTTAQRNQFAINRMLMLLAPALALAGSAVALWTGTLDLIRYYAVYTLVVQLMLLYVPTHRFISKRGGERAFGLVKTGVGECLCAIVLGLGLFFLVNAITGMVQLFCNWLGAQSVATGAPLHTGLDWRLAATVLLIGIIPAYTEEALFRGALLFSWLPGGRRKAVLHSAALFALVYLSPIALPAMFVMGIVLGVVSSWTKSIMPSVIMHGVNNLASIVLSVLLAHSSPATQSALEQIPAVQYLLVLFALGLLLLAIWLPLMRSAARRGVARREAGEPLPEDTEAQTIQEEIPPAIVLPPSVSPEVFGKRYLRLPVMLTYGFLIAVNVLQLLFIFTEAAM